MTVTPDIDGWHLPSRHCSFEIWPAFFKSYRVKMFCISASVYTIERVPFLMRASICWHKNYSRLSGCLNASRVVKSFTERKR